MKTGNREPGTGNRNSKSNPGSKPPAPASRLPAARRDRLPAPGSPLPTLGASTRLAFTADAEAAGDRLDRFLTAQIPDFSRSQIQRLIEGGHVTHSRHKKVKANNDIREGDVVSVDLPEAQPSTALPEDIPLDIL